MFVSLPMGSGKRLRDSLLAKASVCTPLAFQYAKPGEWGYTVLLYILQLRLYYAYDMNNITWNLEHFTHYMSTIILQ